MWQCVTYLSTIVLDMSANNSDSALSAALWPKARAAIIGLLFGRPDEAFYLREIVERTGLGVGHVQRELKRLTDAGVFERTERGRHVYFQADRDCPIFDELRGIATKTMGAPAVLRDALAPLADRIVAAFIFGSFARGDEHSGSDIDLMVIGDTTFAEVVRAIRPAEAKLDRPINPTVYPVAEFRAKRAAGHHFVNSVMNGEKQFILGDADELADLPGERLDSRA